MFRKKILYILILFSVFLAACSNNVVDEAKKIREEGQNVEKTETLQEDQQPEYNVQEGSTVHEVKENIDEQREEKETVELEEIEGKESFKNKEEFAQYVARILYDFESKAISPEIYYNFLMSHGSRVFLKDFDDTNKEDIILGYEDLQKLINKVDTHYNGYKISELTLDEPEIYAYFYRSVETEGGMTNYITTIVKEGDTWKFDNDELSSGYIEQQ
ncbi:MULTISPECIES: hypothetical protein [Oceanobacillus]|uniref:Uncharacterized protein n=1 Tax=Oceanobacillus kimchii TaxID=746691 RepID=A0ABQ5TQV6_9BACI|nr:hypothetical protein [Oceanobacillus kimchii]GLO68291.1 hypothetical protein MACH08_40750 [Oceanobacillus kimchii]